jgi:hypothetical protein
MYPRLQSPQVFLASTEGYGLEEPRAVRTLQRLSYEQRDDLLLVELDPPLVGQLYGLGDKDVAHVVLATRYKEDDLFEIQKWPVHVHVARLTSRLEGDHIPSGGLDEIGWGELYPSKEEAHQARK